MNTEQILLSLTDLRHNLRQAQFPLDLPEAITQAGLARRIANQLNDYILPRLETIDAPLLAVVGGSTGAGKSTLVNSLVGRMVTQPGVVPPQHRPFSFTTPMTLSGSTETECCLPWCARRWPVTTRRVCNS